MRFLRDGRIFVLLDETSAGHALIKTVTDFPLSLGIASAKRRLCRRVKDGIGQIGRCSSGHLFGTGTMRPIHPCHVRLQPRFI